MTSRALALALFAGLAGPTMAHAAPVTSSSEISTAAPSAADDRKDGGACVVEELCFGPMLTLGAMDPLGLGVHARYGKYFGFGLDYQFLPMSLEVGGASADWSLFTVEGRVYPFAGAFFVGGGFGYQSFSGSMHTMTAAGDVGVSGSVGIPALKLGVGFMGRDGFVLGADVGFNIPLGGIDVEFDSVTGAAAANAPTQVAQMKSEIDAAADDVFNILPVIPQINLIRMGYLF